jgi:hypothetical protein
VKVVYKAIVGAEGSPEVMEANGTAVGFVDRSVTGTVTSEEGDVEATVPLGTRGTEPEAAVAVGPVAVPVAVVFFAED